MLSNTVTPFFQGIVGKILSELSIGPLGKDDLIHEFCRFGGTELHTISAFIGKQQNKHNEYFFIVFFLLGAQ